jgi:S-adenosylmethionine-diacylgycerolhomoserine-N-methlytransferase
MNAPTEFAPDHGVAMDRMYRWQRHIYDASRRFYLLGRNEMLRGLGARPGQSILEIGCGTGRNLAYAAKLYPEANLFGIDISKEMLKTAEANLSAAEVVQRVKLAQGDATNFVSLSCFQNQIFDLVYFSYTLSMVPEWQKAIAHALTMLGDHGELHIVDFGQCENWPVPLKRVMFRWLKLFGVFPRHDLPIVLQEFAVKNDLRLNFTSTFSSYVWRAVLRTN